MKILVVLKILLQLRKIRAKKNFSGIVFFVEDLFIKDFLDQLLSKYRFCVCIHVEAVSLAISDPVVYSKLNLNIYLLKKKTIKIFTLKNRLLNIIFDVEQVFKLECSGLYNLGVNNFDIKTLVFLVGFINSFFIKKYAKMY